MMKSMGQVVLKTIGIVSVALSIGSAEASDAVLAGITARQRYPWNGKVDITVTFTGASNDVAQMECSFVATNAVTQTALPVTTISPAEGCSISGTTWTRRFVWDAAADVGAAKIDDVALTVDAAPSLGGVQLWKDGPYWAECNVGATKPEEYGYYFWWGDTVGYKRNANNDGWISAKDGTPFEFSDSDCPTSGKGNSQLKSLGYIDSAGNLVAAHDAVTAHLGLPWRMPTGAEFSAMLSNCNTTWTTKNGVNGRLVTGRGPYASKSIFLPAAGQGFGSYRGNAGSGFYWSSTPDSDYSLYAWRLYFGSGNIIRSDDFRDYGQSVRPLRGFVNAGHATAFCGMTTHLSLDCQTGTRTAVKTEQVGFSPVWETDAEGAVATVSVNGVPVTNATKTGVFEWTPTRDGTNTLTHIVSINGKQVGEALTAIFVVSGSDSIPDIGESPSKEQVRVAMSGSTDMRLLKCVTNGVQYVTYRTWATNVQSTAGGLAGTRAVKDSPQAWLSYALDSAVLLTKAPEQGEMKVAAFGKNAETGKFDFSAAIEGVRVGEKATAENLATLFGVEGCSAIDGEYRADNVTFAFGTPTDGRVTISAEPADKTVPQFFLKVKMTP